MGESGARISAGFYVGFGVDVVCVIDVIISFDGIGG